MIELRHLRHFIAVAEELHFARAAQRLGIEQSPLSQSIRNLEAELGTRLLQRTTRRTWLTRAGGRFYREAQRILRDVDDPEIVRLALGEDFAGEPFTRLLFELEHHNPRLDLEIRELLQTEAARLVRDRGADVAITLNPRLEPELTRARGWSEPLMVVAPIGHPFADREKVSLRELADETLALPSNDECPGYLTQIEGLLDQHGVRLTERRDVRHWNTAVTIVVGARDAARVVSGDAQSFYDGVRAKVGDWRLGPPATIVQPVIPVFGEPAADDSDPPDGAPSGVHPQPTTATGDQSATSVNAAGAERDRSPGEVEASTEANGSGIVLEIGTSVDGFEQHPAFLNLSDTRLNQLNMGVVGDLGTGKTQLLKSLVHQIASAAPDNRGIRPRMLIFDYKRDYSDPAFVQATGARVVRPHRLPLNLFDTSGLGESMVPWLDRFRFFSDVLDKIYSGIGPVQRDKLKRAVRGAYGTSGGMPTIYDVHSTYSGLLEGKTDSPMSIIDDLVDMEIFEANADACMPFDQFLNGVVVISLDLLGQDDRSKNMLVAVMLNMFYEDMLRTPKRPFVGTDPQLRAIDSYLLVDEADNIMRYEFDVLRKLLLQGREFGCGVILASQYLRHFKVNATDYREPLLTWFLHKVPSILPAELQASGWGLRPATLPRG